jgi:hypothetical protein
MISTLFLKKELYNIINGDYLRYYFKGGIFFSLKQRKELQKELQKMQANLSISK